MGRGELVEVLTHPAGFDPIAARELLYQRLGHPLAVGHLDRGDESPVLQVGQTCWVVVVVLGGQEARVDRRGVVAEDVLDGVEEHRLPVAAVAVEEEQAVLADVGGDPVAGDPPQILDHRRFAVTPANRKQCSDLDVSTLVTGFVRP